MTLPAAQSPVWTVAAAARRLEIAPATLRSWSLRHGIGPAGHVPGRHRRYTDADIAELHMLRDLLDQGMAISAAATIVRHRRLRAPAGFRPGSPDVDTAASLVRAAERLDADDTGRIIATGLVRDGVVATWDRLCRPALAELGEATETDRSRADAQLLLTWAIATCLRRLPSPPEVGSGSGALLGCADDEQHTLALEALFAALGECRVPARMLGPATPTAALYRAVMRLRPAVVVVWAQRAATADPAVLGGVTGGAVLVAAGPGWHRADLPQPAQHANTLQDALTMIIDATDRRADPSGFPVQDRRSRPRMS